MRSRGKKILVALIGVGFIFTFWLRLNDGLVKEQVIAADTTSIDEIVNTVVESRRQSLEAANTSAVDFGSQDEINVLVLGLDSRKEYNNPHCDAIHMFTLNVKDWTIKITSVPRGTYSYIPPGNFEENQYYLSNACAIAGMDYGISQIENIVGVKSDYVVTAGFSQVIGILRLFDLPANEGLRWLRHRQSYAIGDPQRSHNQAVFMKDIIVGQLDKFRNVFSVPMQYIFYSTVDTDMDFATAKVLLAGYLDSKIDERPNNIVLQMRPWFPVTDYHFDTENPDEQIQQLMDFIAPYLSPDDLSGQSLESIQAALDKYLTNRLSSKEPIDDILDKRLWLQLEDEERREYFYYEFFVRSLEPLEQIDAMQAIAEYILEKETLDQTEWAEKGKKLLDERL